MYAHQRGNALAWGYVVAVLIFLYLPMAPPLLFSVREPEAGRGAWTLRWYWEMWQNPLLVASIKNSLLIAAAAAAATTPLAVLAAMAVREMRIPRIVILLVLLPLFIPGVSMGLATAFFFRQLAIEPSFWTIIIVHVLWALPFAFLIVLTVMATFDPVYLEAAYVHGANRLRAFLDIELPLIHSGILGAAIVTTILSFNETVRTSLVQGPLNTVQTYIWSTYLQVGLSPTMYALISLLIGLTLALVLMLLYFAVRRTRAAAPAPRA